MREGLLITGPVPVGARNTLGLGCTVGGGAGSGAASRALVPDATDHRCASWRKAVCAVAPVTRALYRITSSPSIGPDGNTTANVIEPPRSRSENTGTFTPVTLRGF